MEDERDEEIEELLARVRARTQLVKLLEAATLREEELRELRKLIREKAVGHGT